MYPGVRSDDHALAWLPGGEVAATERVLLGGRRLASDGPLSVARPDRGLLDVRRSLNELGADPLAGKLDGRLVATPEQHGREEPERIASAPPRP